MRRIPTFFLLAIVSVLWIGTLDSHDTTPRRPSATRAPGSEPSNRIEIPRLMRWDPSAPAAPQARVAGKRSTPSADWLAEVERVIVAREYEASVNHRGLQTPNRAHNLRTYFEPGGIHVMDRTAAGEPELVRMRLSAYGREGALAAAGDARVSNERARIELVRDGLVEWYENSPAGLEQGFTLAARPEGDGPLVLELRVDGADVSLAGEEATFTSTSDGGRRLRYAKLAAFDANGTSLAAYLEACDDGLRIVTDDRDAAYPVTIDPLIHNSADTQLGVFQNLAELGRGVGSAGDVNGDGYGDVLIGSEAYDAGNTNEGAAFLFLGGPNGIVSNGPPAATFQTNQDSGFMGRALTAGDFNGDGYSDIAIGSYGYSLGQSGEGAVFIYPGGPSGISSGSPANATATLQGDDAFSRFGLAVACAGDVNGDGYDELIVGATDYNPANDGAAFIFLGSASGIASAGAASAATRLISSQGGSSFGDAVAGAGDINGDGFADVVIGAAQYDLGQSNEGAAFIYLGHGTGIAHGGPGTAHATLQSDVAGVQIGVSAAGLGDVNGDGYSDIAVGSGVWVNGSASEGAVWVFHGSNSGIASGTIANAAFFVEGNQISARLGATLCLAGAGDVNGDGYADLLVSANAFDNGQTDEGMAFVMIGGPTGITGTLTTAYARLEVNQASALHGSSVAGAGDINGDGYDDVIVGTLRWDGNTADEGAGFIYLGGARGMSNSASPFDARAWFDPEQFGVGAIGANMGRSVSSADVNGDGYRDMIVGSPGYDAGEMDEGAAFIFFGGTFADGTPSNANTLLQSNSSGSLFGWSVAGAEDVNGDGYGDVIIGAPGMTDSTGVAYVYLGSPTGVPHGDPSSASTTLSADQAAAEMGSCVAGPGDIDGDGFADVLVASRLYDSGKGAVFIFRGSASGIASASAATAATRLISPDPGVNFGHSAAGAGDVNGDGFADIIIGAPKRAISHTLEGAAYVFHGSALGIWSGGPIDANATLHAAANGAFFGTSVAGAGDVNGDGFGDVIVGAPHYGPGNVGAAFVWCGGGSGVPNGTPTNAIFYFPGALAAGEMGASVAGVGDLNGDGLADMIVGITDPTNFLGQGCAANVYMGDATPPPIGASTLPFAVLDGISGGHFGASVAGAGDVDGDGFADLIVGEPIWDGGRAFVYNGGNTVPGRTQFVRQRTGGPTGRPLQPWGLSYAADRFRVAAVAVDADGRKRVKTEIEHCPCGVPFGSVSCTKTVSPTWMDTGGNASGLAFAELLTSVPTGLRRWRLRTLMAQVNVTLPGITAPPNPVHGPWRRLQGQVVEADVRVMLGAVAVEIRHDPSSFAIERLVNPTRGRIEFTVVLSGTEPVKAELFDVAGRRWLARDLPGHATRTEFRWDEGRNLPSGAYLLRITQGPRTASARVVVLH